MKTIPGPQLIIFHKTLKMIYASFSVSPGHIYDAIYSQIKCKMNMKLPPNTNFIYLGSTFENKDKSTTIYSISRNTQNDFCQVQRFPGTCLYCYMHKYRIWNEAKYTPKH